MCNGRNALWQFIAMLPDNCCNFCGCGSAVERNAHAHGYGNRNQVHMAVVEARIGKGSLQINAFGIWVFLFVHIKARHFVALYQEVMSLAVGIKINGAVVKQFVVFS